jgi:hypothetical protein
MYLWASRFLTGHAGGAVVAGASGRAAALLVDSLPEAAATLPKPVPLIRRGLSSDAPLPLAGDAPPLAFPSSLGGPSMSVSVEYHHFIVPGARTTPTIAPYMPALVPWLICAVRRAKRPPGTPPCAALSLGWTAAFFSLPNLPNKDTRT